MLALRLILTAIIACVGSPLRPGPPLLFTGSRRHSPQLVGGFMRRPTLGSNCSLLPVDLFMISGVPAASRLHQTTLLRARFSLRNRSVRLEKMHAACQQGGKSELGEKTLRYDEGNRDHRRCDGLIILFYFNELVDDRLVLRIDETIPPDQHVPSAPNPECRRPKAEKEGKFPSSSTFSLSFGFRSRGLPSRWVGKKGPKKLQCLTPHRCLSLIMR